jgi:hypothetical protein
MLNVFGGLAELECDLIRARTGIQDPLSIRPPGVSIFLLHRVRTRNGVTPAPGISSANVWRHRGPSETTHFLKIPYIPDHH